MNRLYPALYLYTYNQAMQNNDMIKLMIARYGQVKRPERDTKRNGNASVQLIPDEI